VVVEAPDTARTPDSGTTTASRQTVFSGEAAIIAAKKLGMDIESLMGGSTATLEVERERTGRKTVYTEITPVHKDADATNRLNYVSFHDALRALEGREYYSEYKPETDPIGSEKQYPVSHVAYGYAAQVAQLDDRGKLIKITAAYDSGTVVNPKAAEGQIEGGIVMSAGYALTEDYPLSGGYPQARYGTLGLIRATDAPEIETIFVKREGRTEAAYGAKGVGELAAIPSAPAIQGAYYKLDGKFRTKLPMEDTYYR